MPETKTRTYDTDREKAGLLDYLQVIAKRKKLILTVTFAAFCFSVAVALLLPKTYASTALILPPQPNQGIMGMIMGDAGGGGLGSLASSFLGTGTPADQYASILQSQAIKDTIIDRFKLMDAYEVKYRTDMYKQMDDFVKVEAGSKDGIISITVEDKDPKRAADIANAYVDELDKLTVGLTRAGGSQNRTFLGERLAKSKADLARAEENMKAFQQKNKTFQLPEQVKLTIANIGALKAQLALQETQLATLRRTYTDSSQEVKNAQESIKSLNSQISRLEGGSGSGAIPAFGSAPAMGEGYARLMREIATQEAIVELLTKQYEVAALSEANDVSNINVIQKARASDKKIKPKRALIVISVTFFSFVVSVLWSLLRAYVERLPEDELMKWKGVIYAFSLGKNGGLQR